MEDINGNFIDDVFTNTSPKENGGPGRKKSSAVCVTPTPSPQKEGEGTPSIQWCEVEEDGAIYNTALKRVRYHSLTSDHSDEGNISFKQWETVKIKQIKAGSLEKLVEYLTPATMDANEFDSGFILAFLCTYKSFSATSEVIDLLLKRFVFCENNICCDSSVEETYFKGIMKRICSVITIWFEKYPNDFDEPPMYPTISSIITFSQNYLHLNGAGMVNLHNASKAILDKLSVCPFDYDVPYTFKFCSCLSVVGCTCEASICSATFEHQQSLNMRKFSAELIAEQLTLVDSELFLKVSPRECLGSFWSKRDKSLSIRLTVDQFNAVSLKVISTILSSRNKQTNNFTASARAKSIEKWINVALELRELKNFSSLKAILSSLQSSAIYRLSRTWGMVSKDCSEIYDELSKIFADDMNNKASRDLLKLEGTAKYSTHTLKKSQKRDTWKREGVTYGTVPYLGTFLTDLMMIDTAHPDKCKNDLINFEKRRKEFEVIVQIKLFQQAAKDYHLAANRDFFTWWNAIPEYSEKECYNKSLEIEPIVSKDMVSTPQPKRRGNKIKRCKSESDMLLEQKQKSFSFNDPTSVLAKKLTSVVIAEPTQQPAEKPKEDEQEFKVVRVYLEDSVGAQYKSLKLYPDTRACDVISDALRKFNVPDEPIRYSLYQILDNKKLHHLPMNSNMYYTMTKCKKDLCFRICRKRFGKKWKEKGNNTTKLASFHQQLRKSKSVDAQSYGVMLQSYSPTQ